MTHQPLQKWFVIALGIVLGVGFVVAVLVTIVNPTVETLTGLAAVVIPTVLLALDSVVRALRRRRSTRLRG